MQSVTKFAKGGGLVMGICNGFQILCESGLLPGALMRNASQHYICKQTFLRTETTDSPFTHGLTEDRSCRCPSGTWKATTSATPTTLAAEGRRSHRLPLCHACRRDHRGGKSQWVA